MMRLRRLDRRNHHHANHEDGIRIMLRLANIAKPALLAVAMIIPNAALAADSPLLKTGPTVLTTRPVPSVPLSAIAKEVSPGYFELDPVAAQGKHIILPAGRGFEMCIGRRDKDGSCRGIYFNNKD
jgi:hypothetical protein